MQCEMCGATVADALKVELEGSTVVACPRCAGMGRVVGRVGPSEKKRVRRMQERLEKPAEEGFKVEDEWELTGDYAEKIRKSREKRGWKQEELAKKINEPASLIHRIESGRIEPSQGVGRKLQRALDVRLYSKREDEKIELKAKSRDELTLGDMIVVRRRKKE